MRKKFKKAAYCPGVSNPCVVGGLNSEEIIEIMFLCGKNPNIFGVDLTDFNPRFEDYRTGFLLGYMIYYFNLGMMTRLTLK